MTVIESQPITDPRVPHPRRRVPLLGDILTFDGDAPCQSAVNYAEDLGPIYQFSFMGARYVIASGADLVGDLNDERRFCKYVGRDLEALRIMGGDGLFTAYNDEPNWHKAHKLLMPAFTQAAMRRYHPMMLDVAAELTAHWDARAGADTVDVSADTTRVTLETIGRCAAGHSFGCFETETMHPFVEHMVEGLRGSDRLGVFRSTFLPGSSPTTTSARFVVTPRTCTAPPTRSSRRAVRKDRGSTTTCSRSCWRRTSTRPISVIN